MQKHILSKQEVLDLIPQKHPFRFVDEILELSDQHIVGKYTFCPDEFFYAGHFPGKPLTPGVILLEAMAQVGVVAFGIYLLASEIGTAGMDKYLTIFTDGQVEFSQPILPGQTVTMKGEKVFWRQKKLRARVEMFNEENQLVANCTVSGMGVLR